jgi:hypothetical protein
MVDYDTPVKDDVVQTVNDIEIITLPSLTYRVIDGRISGKIDALDAMRQAIEKIFSTDRFVLPIYSDQYGNDLSELLGKEMPYVKADLGRVFDEALKADDRVDAVEINSVTQSSRDTLIVVLTVSTMFGDIKTESEVIV